MANDKQWNNIPQGMPQPTIQGMDIGQLLEASKQYSAEKLSYDQGPGVAKGSTPFASFSDWKTERGLGGNNELSSAIAKAAKTKGFVDDKGKSTFGRAAEYTRGAPTFARGDNGKMMRTEGAWQKNPNYDPNYHPFSQIQPQVGPAQSGQFDSGFGAAPEKKMFDSGFRVGGNVAPTGEAPQLRTMQPGASGPPVSQSPMVPQRNPTAPSYNPYEIGSPLQKAQASQPDFIGNVVVPFGKKAFNAATTVPRGIYDTAKSTFAPARKKNSDFINRLNAMKSVGAIDEGVY